MDSLDSKFDLLIPSDWPLIIGSDYNIYWRLAMAIPRFGKLTLTTQTYWRKQFTKKSVDRNREVWTLADKIHRDGDLPAITVRSYPSPVCVGKTIRVYSWFKHNKIHRDSDKPAVIYEGYSQEWWQNNRLHRDDDLPAKVYADGDQRWYRYGVLHRDNDLPAKLSPHRKVWVQHGQEHRDNGLPCIIHKSGKQQMWKIRGQLHRDHGLPAITNGSGYAEWWENGMLIKSGWVFPSTSEDEIYEW